VKSLTAVLLITIGLEARIFMKKALTKSVVPRVVNPRFYQVLVVNLILGHSRGQFDLSSSLDLPEPSDGVKILNVL